jgi:hypothetical protein
MKDMAEAAAKGKGILYILTNPVMPGLVKIGFTTETIEKRIRDLSRPSGIPVRFDCYFAAEVSSEQEKELRLHELFKPDRVNLKREFFRVDPERVVLAIKMGHFKEVTPRKSVVNPVEEKAFEKAEKVVETRLAKFTFDSVGIPVGALLRFTRDQSDTATVVPGNKVKYGEDVVNISDAAKSALKKIGKDWKRVRGPMYWLYNGKTLHELHEKISG